MYLPQKCLDSTEKNVAEVAPPLMLLGCAHTIPGKLACALRSIRNDLQSRLISRDRSINLSSPISASHEFSG